MGPTHCTVAQTVGARESVDVLVRSLRANLAGDLRGRRVTVWGLGPSTPPFAGGRVSGVRLVEALLEEGAAVSAYDPIWLDDAYERLGANALLLDDGYLAAIEAEALVLTSGWPRDRRPDFERLRACMARPFLIDASTWLEGAGLIGFRFDRFGAASAGFGFLTRPGEA